MRDRAESSLLRESLRNVADLLAADAHYFKAVADYIHLNPVLAGLAGGAKGKLVDFPWSSVPQYSKGNLPAWLAIDRVLGAFKLSHDRRGRGAYVAWLEARASAEMELNTGGASSIDDQLMQLEAGDTMDDELSALKSKMGMGGTK